MLQALQHFILWGKFRSLNNRYHALIQGATKNRDEVTMQHMEENFWYETALLLERRRQLQFPKPSSHPLRSNLPVSSIYPKTLMTTRTQPATQYFPPQQPPSAIFIVLFSLLSGIATGTGILWLVAPHMLY